MPATVGDLVALFAKHDEKTIKGIMEKVGRLALLDREREKIVADLAAMGVAPEGSAAQQSAFQWEPPSPPAPRRDLCASCDQDAVMTVDGVRFCETHGDLASVRIA